MCRFQDFYTGGEREAMADEISNLRDQVRKPTIYLTFDTHCTENEHKIVTGLRSDYVSFLLRNIATGSGVPDWIVTGFAATGRAG